MIFIFHNYLLFVVLIELEVLILNLRFHLMLFVEQFI